MKSIGIDIGTTSICAVLTDRETGKLLETETVLNPAWDTGADEGFERIQHPGAVIDTVRKMKVFENDDVSEIGVTGQMHGILYLDADGRPVSPLYTWQDERGNLPYADGLTYAEHLTGETGFRCASGYGIVTHFYNVKNRLVPRNAAALCTIGDYVAMTLSGVKKPLMNATNAHSIGFYDIDRGFDCAALEKVGVDPSVLPDITKEVSIIGETPGGVCVKTAIGDNQASVYGAAGSNGGIIVNVGTGSQISMISHTSKRGAITSPNIEVRPYFGDKILIVGSALTGGDAYAALERFFARTAEMLGIKLESDIEIYAKMEEWLKRYPAQENGITVDTRFKGTRSQPSLRGAIYGVDSVSFTPEALIHGFLSGIAEELHSLYREMPREELAPQLIGTGNGIRKNKYLRVLFEKLFGMELCVPLYEEEAAYGAAVLNV